MIIQSITPVPIVQASAVQFRIRNVVVDLGVTACGNYDLLDQNSNVLYSGQAQMDSAQYASWGGNDAAAFQVFAQIAQVTLTGSPTTFAG